MEKLNNQNKLDIQRLVGEGKTCKQIAKELGKKEETINNYVAKTVQQLIMLSKNGVNVADGNDASQLPEKTEAQAQKPNNTAFIKHKGAVIMTEAQGMRSDISKKKTNKGFSSDVVVKARQDG